MIARRSLLRELVVLCIVVGGLLCVWSAPALAQRKHVFSASFGGATSTPANPEPLSQPGALAVNEETGDVYVIDRGNSRVEIFNSKGEYEGQFNGSASPTGAFSWPSSDMYKEGSEGAIAVDNSTNPVDPSKGDVYVMDVGHGVIDKFTAHGAYIGQVTGTSSSSQFTAGTPGLSGIAVDPNGALWAHNGTVSQSLDQFNDAHVNEYVSSVEEHTPNTGVHIDLFGYIGFAFDSVGNLYAGLRPDIFEKFTFPSEFSKTGEVLTEKLDNEETTGLAVDLSSNDTYVDHETSVAAYSPSHTSIERFGSAQMEASEGIAVDAKTGTVYTANASSQEIDAFTAFVVPDVTTGPASSFTETSVTVGGVVNPDGLPVTSCVFEYGTSESYGQSEPCSPSPGNASKQVAITAQLKGLEPLTRYHFRLNASNANGSNAGQDRTFVMPEPVALSEESVTDVSSESALFSVQVNPGGADTTYNFEYGPSMSYGESVPIPEGDLGAGVSSVPVSVRAEGLLGETTYHVRVVASNVLGTVYGSDQTFTTQAGGGKFVLPDGREWELVSPPNKEGAIILPIGGRFTGHRPQIEASADGSVVSYAASAPLGVDPLSNAAPAGFAQVLSRRGGAGWSSEDISTPHKAAGEGQDPEYSFFSPDLSRGIVEPYGDTPLSPEATEATPYVRDDSKGSYVPLVTANNVEPGTKFGFPSIPLSESPHVVAVTPDLSHVIVLLNNHTLYEWSGGRLRLVGGTELGGDSRGRGQNTRNALSRDGSRVFVTEESAQLSMRDTVTGQKVTVPGEFQIANTDGSKVFVSKKGDLEVCQIIEEAGELKCDMTDLAPGGEVQSEVVGAGENGSIVYFVGTGKLAEGAEAGKYNLYVESQTGLSWSAPKLVAVLAEADSMDWVGTTNENAGLYGETSHLTSRVSPNGRYLTFMSDQSLTGYDNRDANSRQSDEELFLYDAATGELRCVSCNPTGARPDGILDPGYGINSALLVDEVKLWAGAGRWLAASIPGWTEPQEPIGWSASYQSRVLSDEGRIFFDSADALVPQDTNGKEDVYEYEPVGIGGPGGCTTAARTYVASEGGCVSLISSGTSNEESAFLDASEGGNDVFFLTTARLTWQDVDSSFDVYDAHVCSAGSPCVSVPVSPPPCTSGDACKAAPSPQSALFGAPSSATFSGAGNVAYSQSTGSTASKRVTKQKASRRKHKSKSRGKHREKGRGRGKSVQARRGLSAGTRR